MIDWAFIVVPLVVLPIVILFRFVGCAALANIGDDGKDPSPPTPNYPKYILGESNNNGANVIAYWRLVDPPSTPDVAKDLKDFRPGLYIQGHSLPLTANSEKRDPGHFVLVNSLIDSDPRELQCRAFNGGYVLVDHKPGLYSEEFTIEAWIKVEALSENFEHTLFQAGGLYASPAGTAVEQRGFRIFANGNKRWQMRIGRSPVDLFENPPIVPLGPRTHLAVTMAKDGPPGTKKKVTLYVDGKETRTATLSSYAPPYDAPLFIGVDNETDTPTGSTNLRTPVLCKVQEVVLHRKALSREEIESHVDINRPL